MKRQDPAPESIKPAYFIGSVRDDLRALPETVRRRFGFAIREAQLGGKSMHAKPLKGFKGAGVLEVIEDYESDTYRAVYTVKFASVIYILHVFQKKSTQGIKTPARELALVEERLRQAEHHYTHTLRKIEG